MEKTKFTYIGGNGKVGREALEKIYRRVPEDAEMDLVLIGSGTEESIKRLRGLVKDIEAALSVDSIYRNVQVTYTNEYENIKNSDLVMVSAGAWPSKEEKEKYRKIDSSGRLAQSFVNKKLIENIGEKISKYTPKAVVGVITNQVDMMSEVMRKATVGNQTVLGIGGTVDTARFRLCLYKKLKKLKEFSDLKLKEVSGHMFGYHNNNMIYLEDSVSIKGRKLKKYLEEKTITKELMEGALSETRKYGGRVSKLQKRSKYPNTDTGSSKLPGNAIAEFVCAYLFKGRSLEGGFNMRLDRETAHIYGVGEGSSLSVPVSIDNGKIKFVKSYEVLYIEKLNCQKMQKSIGIQVEKLMKESSRGMEVN